MSEPRPGAVQLFLRDRYMFPEVVRKLGCWRYKTEGLSSIPCASCARILCPYNISLRCDMEDEKPEPKLCTFPLVAHLLAAQAEDNPVICDALRGMEHTEGLKGPGRPTWELLLSPEINETKAYFATLLLRGKPDASEYPGIEELTFSSARSAVLYYLNMPANVRNAEIETILIAFNEEWPLYTYWNRAFQKAPWPEMQSFFLKANGDIGSGYITQTNRWKQKNGRSDFING